MAVTGLILLTASGSALASGYRIPEQSVNSTARAGGYVAHTPGADATYFNPANMVWLDDRGHVEVDATWIHLSGIEYTDRRTPLYSGQSEEEDFLMPTLFAVSPDYNRLRVGFSLTAPAGLSKRWMNPFPRTFAEEFTLKVFDLNPTLAYKISDKISLGGGVRAVFAEGKVKSAGMVASGVTASRDMEGDTWEAGYNLALTVRPVDKLNLSLTYRSEVDLGIDGNATLRTSAGSGIYTGDTGVEIPLPAVLAVAASYTLFDQLTVELEWDRTFWSDYEYLDFTYPAPLANPVLFMAFDSAKPKHWEDSEAWRLSASYDMKNGFTLMAGLAYDETPVPESTLGFELPDSDAIIYSLGLRYQVNKDLEVGAAYLYDDKESRDVQNDSVHGSFKDSVAHLLTFGLSYKF
jgi:long-chain fatty acid transport protein